MTSRMILAGCLLAAVAASPVPAQAPGHSQVQLPRTMLFGVAYYDEYTPTDRVDEDARMMKAAGINVVRIAESTWGTLERAPGVFDFRHVDRMLTAMHAQGIKVIVGTPTYAVPTWLSRMHPDVLVNPGTYGPRQNMDITNPDYLAAAERVIVALVRHVKDHPAVIGYQVDNETKPNGVANARVQAGFVASLKKKWGSLDALNTAWGLNYWSNRINSWDDFPNATTTINASMANAFAAYQRSLVTDFLRWQASLVRTNARPDQFITQNFDLGWAGHSYGLQPVVDHWEAARALDVTGVDIYHPSQQDLTGTEIAFGGDLSRSIRNGQNYLVLETEAQGFAQWTPFPGQLRLQAYSHMASGANMVAYWHWATTANAIETYWRGLLAQDYRPNPVYDEAKTIGADLAKIGPKLVDLKKNNRVALYVSNRALTAFDSFRDFQGGIGYNDIVRRFYDALYRQNVEVDLISPSSTVPLDRYKLIVVPALYSASDAEIEKLNDFARAGGHLVYTLRSGFTDENTRVRYATQPGGIAQAAGAGYQLFTIPEGVSLKDDPFAVGADRNKVEGFMEMLTPTTAEAVARYQHPSWPDYAGITRNRWGKGQVSYVGFLPAAELAEKIMADEVRNAGLELPAARWPLIVRGGTMPDGRTLRYMLNYSARILPAAVPQAGKDLLTGRAVGAGQSIDLPAWGVAIIESSAPKDTKAGRRCPATPAREPRRVCRLAGRR